MPELLWSGLSASKTMKVLNGIGVTLAVATGTYLIGVNILHPWQGLHFTASSDFELWIAIVLTVLASAVCLWRLMTSSGPTDELRRFGDALGSPDDLS